MSKARLLWPKFSRSLATHSLRTDPVAEVKGSGEAGGAEGASGSASAIDWSMTFCERIDHN